MVYLNIVVILCMINLMGIMEDMIYNRISNKEGRFLRGAITTRISLRDIAAGVLFVKEAGGDILHFDGVPDKWSEFEAEKCYDLIASNGKVRIGF